MVKHSITLDVDSQNLALSIEGLFENNWSSTSLKALFIYTVICRSDLTVSSWERVMTEQTRIKTKKQVELFSHHINKPMQTQKRKEN